MGMLPPPASGLGIHASGDRLIVHFRPRRSKVQLALLAYFLACWTGFGLVAFSALVNGTWETWGSRAFIALWLCGWALGECAVPVMMAWQLRGREILSVTSREVEVRKEIGRFSRTKRYEAALVHDVTAARVPSGEDERPRSDYCLKVSYDEETLRVGEGLGESDAEHVASLVMAQIRPRRWWGEQGPSVAQSHDERPHDDGVQTASRRQQFAVVLIGALAVGAVWGVGEIRSGDGDDASRPRTVSAARTTPSSERRPSAESFSDPRKFASATTSYGLRSARVKVTGTPNCGDNVSWTEWRCTVRAKATLGPFAGRTMRYFCASAYSTGPGGRRSQGFSCGPDRPPISGGPLPPSRDAFSDPAKFAAAMTIYALTSGRTSVRGAPSCRDRVTWTRWRCTVPARATLGPFAGRTVTYYCSRDSSTQRTQSVTCGPDRPLPLDGGTP